MSWSIMLLLLFNIYFIYLFWLLWVFLAALRIFLAACGLSVAACRLLVAACMWDLVPRPGIEPTAPALGVWSLTYWTTREISYNVLIIEALYYDIW